MQRQQTNSQILNCVLVLLCWANLKPQPNLESSLDHTVSLTESAGPQKTTAVQMDIILI